MSNYDEQLPLTLKVFHEKDRDEVLQLWHDCKLVVPQNDPNKDIDRKLKVNPDLFIVGIVNNKVVASVMGGYEGHRGWINYLAVSPKHQGKGFGRQIMRYVEKLIKDKGCPKINLQVRETNTGVIAFYEAIGYKMDPVLSMGLRFENDE